MSEPVANRPDQSVLPPVFFHCGLGKVGSTWLQFKVFPHVQHMRFLRGGTIEGNERLMQRHPDSRYLISMGLDTQIMDRLVPFARLHRDAGIVIILRQPDSWIASQYRRYVKNGGHRSFRDFFDLEHDQGLWKRQYLDFYQLLLDIESLFDYPPIVLFHEDMKQDPLGFVQLLARIMGTGINPDQVSLEPYHKSYSTPQLKVMRQVGRWLYPHQETPTSHTNPVWQCITRRTRLLVSYLFLNLARLIPESWLGQEPLIPPKELDAIREAYAGNWAACQAYPGAVRL